MLFRSFEIRLAVKIAVAVEDHGKGCCAQDLEQLNALVEGKIGNLVWKLRAVGVKVPRALCEVEHISLPET